MVCKDDNKCTFASKTDTDWTGDKTTKCKSGTPMTCKSCAEEGGACTAPTSKPVTKKTDKCSVFCKTIGDMNAAIQ